MGLKKLSVISGPMVLAAVWYLGTFLLSRRYGINAMAGKASIWHLTAPIALLLAVGLFFAFMIYLQPQAGYMRSIVCLDRETGKILWNRHGFHAAASRKFPSNSYATPTPVTDGRYIAAHYGPGMVCTDLEGSVKWIKMEPNYTKHLRYGAGASPIMFLNKVIYPFMAEFSGIRQASGNVSDSYLAAFDKETGEFLWRVQPPGAHDSYWNPDTCPAQGKTRRDVWYMGARTFL